MSSASWSAIALGDWAFLPPELLGLILDKIEVWRDYVRCGSVCRPWLSAALDRQQQQPSNRVPLLLIPTKDRSRQRRGLYSVTRDKALKEWEVRVPINSLRCCGSSHGWLATADEDMGITLLNPFSGKTIRLPPLTTQLGRYYRRTKERPFLYQYLIKKVVLSADPALMPNDFVVVAIFSVFQELAYFKSGQNNSSWNYIGKDFFVKPVKKKSVSYVDGGLFIDAIFRQDGKLLYVIDHLSGLISVDYSGQKPEVRVVVQRPSIRSYADPDYIRQFASMAYIVESSSGADLLLVQRVHADETRHETSHFTIFKLSKNKALRWVWVEINSLGHDAMFLGDNYSLALAVPPAASELVKPNCIYYTDNCTRFLAPPQDMGIYSLEDGKISPHYHMKARHRRMPPSIWIVPPTLRGIAIATTDGRTSRSLESCIQVA